MPTKSPSIRILERDQSQFAAVESPTILAVVGYATRGPMGDPTLTTSFTDFVSKFGPAPKDSPYSSLAIRRAFRHTNQVVFSRVITPDALYAERVIAGSSPVSWSLRIRAKDPGSALNGSFVVFEQINNPIGDTEFNLNFYVVRGGDSILTETFEDVSLNANDDNFFVSRVNAGSLDKGSDSIRIELDRGDTSIFSVSLETSTAYVLGDEQVGDSNDSEWKAGDSWGASVGDSIAYQYRAGTDGIPITGGDTAFVNALATSTDLANAELFDYHILITPDNNNQAVQGAALGLAEFRRDFLYLVDPPAGLNQDDIIEWHNGTGSHGRTTALNSSYGALYYSWLTDFDPDSGEYVNSPPSVFAAEKLLETDRLFYPWTAAAGSTRGVIQAFDYEFTPSFGQREAMYGDLNAVNPIVNFPSRGLVIWGQKTLLRNRSALNRINVRRMLIYIKKLLRTSLDSVLFEPNDPSSWVRATAIVTAILEPVRQRRGISEYTVAFDNTTTSADDIANNILRGRVRIVPLATIEIIDVGINILQAGTTISESS